MSTEYGEYADIEKYQTQIEGKAVESVHINEDCDDGLVLTFTDGTKLTFGFAGNEGTIVIEEQKT